MSSFKVWDSFKYCEGVIEMISKHQKLVCSWILNYHRFGIVQNLIWQNFYEFDDLLAICQIIVEMLWSEFSQLSSF